MTLLLTLLLLAGVESREAVGVPRQFITSCEPDVEGFFGNSVDVSGVYAVVGAPSENHGAWDNLGAAYVLRKKCDGWEVFQKLLPEIPYQENAHFGTSVAIYGDVIAVGAPDADSPSLTDAGAIYTYKRNATTGLWELQDHEFGVYGSASGFGAFLDLSENYLIVGAHQYSASSRLHEGRAYVFPQANGNLGYPLFINNPNIAAGDNFGVSVSVHEPDNGAPTIVVGADRTGSTQTGEARVYTKIGPNWVPQGGALKPQFPNAGDFFGTAVAVYDDWIMVGSPGYRDTHSRQGAVYMFHRTDGVWTQSGDILTAENPYTGDLLGTHVDLNARTALAGAPYYGTGGAAILYNLSGGQWEARDFFESDTAGEHLGTAVALDCENAFAGAFGHTVAGQAGAGAAYAWDVILEVRDWDPEPAQFMTTDLVPPGSGFAQSVSLDGSFAAVGNRLADIGGVDTGGVMTFQRFGDTWNLQSVLAQPLLESNTAYGDNVDIDGDFLFVSANREASHGDYTGAVYVYKKFPVRRPGVTYDWALHQTLISPNPGGFQFFGNYLKADHGRLYVTETHHVWQFSYDPQSDLFDTHPIDVLAGTGLTGLPAWDVYGDHFLLGNIAATHNGWTNAGEVIHLVRNVGSASWRINATIIKPNPRFGERFGGRVALGDGLAFIGATGEDRTGNPDVVPKLHVLEYNGFTFDHTWTIGFPGTQYHILGPLAVDGDTLYFNDTNPAPGFGRSIHIYEKSGVDWIPSYFQTYPIATGNTMEVKQRCIMIGAATLGDSFEGGAYIFKEGMLPDDPCDTYSGCISGSFNPCSSGTR